MLTLPDAILAVLVPFATLFTSSTNPAFATVSPRTPLEPTAVRSSQAEVSK